MPVVAWLAILLVLLLVATALAWMLARRSAEARALAERVQGLEDRFQPVLDADAERARVLAGLEEDRRRLQAEMAEERVRTLQALEQARQQLSAEIVRLTGEREQATRVAQAEQQKAAREVADVLGRLTTLRAELNALDEEANLQSFGFYRPHYDFADSAAYQVRLDAIRERQKQMLKDKTAAVCRTEWQINGSKAEGKKQTDRTLKLMLRAFNGESDAAVAKVKYNNIGVMEARIRKAWEAINGLNEINQCVITSEYLALKLDELRLAHEYQEKVQAEKEEQRRIREQMREEEQALRELEKARETAEREERRYEEALRKAREELARAEGAKQEKLLAQMAELERKLAEAHANKERAISRAQLTRSGHVYVISNVGSFGEHVYKIGMTRRLDPFERVRELGDASVPFEFDVHAILYTEDAPALENTLHRLFHARRVNLINERKEFFRVTIDEIAVAVTAHHGEIELTRIAEAPEYRKTLALLKERDGGGPSAPVPEQEARA